MENVNLCQLGETKPPMTSRQAPWPISLQTQDQHWAIYSSDEIDILKKSIILSHSYRPWVFKLASFHSMSFCPCPTSSSIITRCSVTQFTHPLLYPSAPVIAVGSLTRNRALWKPLRTSLILASCRPQEAVNFPRIKHVHTSRIVNPRKNNSSNSSGNSSSSSNSTIITRAKARINHFTTSPQLSASNLKMSSTSTFKIKGLTSLDLPSDKIEVEVENIEKGKLLLLKHGGQIHALTANCTHYGAPLVKGVLTPDARLTCPWHGACFNITTGDVEDAPALNALHKYEVFEKDGGVYVKADEATFKENGRLPVSSCSVAQQDQKVVIIGGGSATIGAVEVLREHGFNGQITIISKEANLPLDRTKLSKALIPDPEKLLLRPQEWYTSVSISVVSDEATSVDFTNKTIATKSGKSIPYTKLILATGGTPRHLPLPGFKELGNIFVLRTIQDVQAILAAVGSTKKKEIVVIGSSFIGMEVGNALSKENNVKIIGIESAPLERIMGAKIGRIFQNNLEKNGVKFYMSASVDKATPSSADPSKVGAVHFKDGTSLPADLVILGVGVSPATEFLRDNPSVTLERDGSLRTDEYFAVECLKGNNSDGGSSDVYAIGDIATYPYLGPGAGQGGHSHVRIEHWDVAQNAGRSVGRTIAHAFSSNSSVPLKAKSFIPIFWSALGGQLRYCGNTMNGYDDLIVKGEPEAAKFVAYYVLGETVVAVASLGMDPIVMKCAELMKRGKMLGKKEVIEGVDVLKVDLA
ncbi:rhodocoxin reductase [Histoplasma capsulatum G186AR]|uniref:Rhodocoxin reductase n=1 Tax=Ajellomyces capsulatus TaxID=5037 RepID=A0A8H7YCK2_AJECA|nr:rhodocoxin reductase [Histoplasma capsulatum]QSS71334.1 rhodocoxin reductase [Histoplasma capsulatum G186AR]